ncbi:MAG: hypothetical protein ACI4PJ_00190 [Acutalibacteraceae bacterium]
MKLHKLLSIILAMATMFSASSSYAEELQAGQTSCENSHSSKKSKKVIYGSAAMSAFALALVSLNFSKWCKHKDETIQKESEKKIEKSVIPEKHDDKKGESVSKVSVNQTERRENWIKILSGETIENGVFRYKSGAEFRRDNDENLEKYHNFIQVFFPTYEASQFANEDLNINACRELWEKVATEESQATIKRIQREMRLNFIRMLLFWGFKVTLLIKSGDGKLPCFYSLSNSNESFLNDIFNYLEGQDLRLYDIDLSVDKTRMSDTGDHNRLRITRVLMALRIFGLDSEFLLFRSRLSSRLRSKKIEDVRSDPNSCCIGSTGKYWNDTDKTKKLSDVLKLKLG